MRFHNALIPALATALLTFEGQADFVRSSPVFPFERESGFFEDLPPIRELEVVDFDQDGDEDLVLLFQWRETVAICWQDEGILSAPEVLYINANGRSAEIDFGDADGDGDLDLFVASEETGKLSWAENQGRGTILAPIHSVTSIGNTLGGGPSLGYFAESAQNLAVRDLDGDGAVEVVCGFGLPYGSDPWELPLVLFHNDGIGNYDSGRNLRPVNGKPVEDVRFSDLGGGEGLYLLATQLLSQSRFGELYCWPVASGTLGSSSSADLGRQVGRTFSADLDDDGVKEVLVLEESGKGTDIGNTVFWRMRVFDIQAGVPQEKAVLISDEVGLPSSPLLVESAQEWFFLHENDVRSESNSLFSPDLIIFQRSGIAIPASPIDGVLLGPGFSLSGSSVRTPNTDEVISHLAELQLQGIPHLIEVVGVEVESDLGFTKVEFKMQARRILSSEVTVPPVLVRGEDDGGLLSGALLAVEVTRDVADFAGWVQYATRDGSAVAGLDYTAKLGTLDFEVGEFSKTLILGHLADNEVEGVENYFVDFLTFSPGFVLVEDEVEVLILDSTSSSLQFDAVRRVVEPVESEFFTPPVLIQINKSSPSAEVSFSYRFLEGTATEGSDYQAGGGTVTIPAGQAFGLISFSPLQDGLFEEEESLELEIYDVSGATLDESRMTIQIRDRVGPRFELAGPSTVPEGGVHDFTLTMNEPASYPVEVSYSLVDLDAEYGLDFSASAVSGMLTFSPGTTEVSLSVQVSGDSLQEEGEEFLVQMGGEALNVLIEDDDLPNILVAGSSSEVVLEVDEEDGMVSIPVTLSKEPGDFFHVLTFDLIPVTAEEGVDFGVPTPVGRQIGFLGTEVSETITIPLVDDAFTESSERFLLRFVDTGDLQWDGGDIEILIRASDEEGDVLTIDSPAFGDFFGTAVGQNEDWLAVVSSDRGVHGAVSLYDADTLEHQWTTEVDGIPGIVRDLTSAEVVLDEDYVLVASPINDAPGDSGRVGLVMVFDRPSGAFLRHLALPANETSNDGDFGEALALCNGVAFVGASGFDVPEEVGTGRIANAGAVVLYDVSTGAELERIYAPTPLRNLRFGEGVAVDGSYLVVGATPSGERGRVFVYERGAQTNLVAEIEGISSGDLFGSSLALSSTHLLVGAPRADVLDSGLRTGAAFLFTMPDLSPVLFNDGFGGESYAIRRSTVEGSQFGSRVALNSSTLVVSSVLASKTFNGTTTSNNEGTVFALDLVSEAQIHRFENPLSGNQSSSRFGSSLSLLGSRLFIGAPSGLVTLPDETALSGAGLVSRVEMQRAGFAGWLQENSDCGVVAGIDASDSLLDYALGGDSLAEKPYLYLEEFGSGLAMNLPEVIPSDVIYIVEESSDLENWVELNRKVGEDDWDAPEEVFELPFLEEEEETIVVSGSFRQGGDSKGFFRLRVELQE